MSFRSTPSPIAASRRCTRRGDGATERFVSPERPDADGVVGARCEGFAAVRGTLQ